MKNNLIKPMLMIMAAPVFAAILFFIKIVPAPPNQGVAILFYLPICMLGVPVCILLGFQKKLAGAKLLAGLILTLIVPCFVFILLSPLWMPSGMSTCKQVDSPGMLARYECVDSSSDDSSYHREFIVEGFKGWPIMRIVEDQ
ncbi:hypothetical protein [Candidatus Villigracilis affinis]|uniref:hypothetical protein n=1 Tax=Candidatus Villigracilis affinis TaxID=3140682 RepID=UPI001D7E4A15|nr:hypothetical protein [Anaerolineales bacterium]